MWTLMSPLLPFGLLLVLLCPLAELCVADPDF